MGAFHRRRSILDLVCDTWMRRVRPAPDTTTPTAPRGAAGAAVPNRQVSGVDGFVLFVVLVLMPIFVFWGVFDLAMMLGVELARFLGMMGCLGGVARGDMRMVAGRLGVARFMIGGGFAVMLGGHLVMISGVGMVFVGVMRGGHVNFLSGLGGETDRESLRRGR